MAARADGQFGVRNGGCENRVMDAEGKRQLGISLGAKKDHVFSTTIDGVAGCVRLGFVAWDHAGKRTGRAASK